MKYKIVAPDFSGVEEKIKQLSKLKKGKTNSYLPKSVLPELKRRIQQLEDEIEETEKNKKMVIGWSKRGYNI